MEPEIENIIELIGNWDPGFSSKEREASFVAQKNIDKIINQYMINNNTLDMYKCCKLCYYLKKHKLSWINKFINYITIDVANKTMLEYYKNRHYDLSQTTKYWTFNQDYEIHLFGYHLDKFEDIIFDNIDYKKIKYILNFYHRKGVYSYHINFIKLIQISKQLEYPKKKFLKKIGWMNSEQYDMITPEYCRFMFHKEISLNEFLAMEKFNKIADLCIDYVYALYNTTHDLECDEITISRDSIDQLITTVEQIKN